MTRPLSTSQRALKAARLMTGPANNASIAAMARAHTVGTALLWRARAVLASGDAALIRKVERGEMTITAVYETLLARREAAGLRRGEPTPPGPRRSLPAVTGPRPSLPNGLEQVGRWVENGAALTSADPAVIVAEYNKVGRPLLEVHLVRVLKLVAGMLAAVRNQPPRLVNDS